MIVLFQANGRVYSLRTAPEVDPEDMPDVLAKDIPAGSPYLVYADGDAPDDIQSAVFTSPDGHGAGPELVDSSPPSDQYQIAKTTPWLRMTDAEGELVYAAMQETSSRLRAIYDAATYLSSGDPPWQTLHDILAATLTAARADQLLAPET